MQYMIQKFAIWLFRKSFDLDKSYKSKKGDDKSELKNKNNQNQK